MALSRSAARLAWSVPFLSALSLIYRYQRAHSRTLIRLSSRFQTFRESHTHDHDQQQQQQSPHVPRQPSAKRSFFRCAVPAFLRASPAMPETAEAPHRPQSQEGLSAEDQGGERKRKRHGGGGSGGLLGVFARRRARLPKGSPATQALQPPRSAAAATPPPSASASSRQGQSQLVKLKFLFVGHRACGQTALL